MLLDRLEPHMARLAVFCAPADTPVLGSARLGLLVIASVARMLCWGRHRD
jgi:hypothetical protein